MYFGCSRINFSRLKVNKQRNYTGFIKSKCCDKCKITNKCYRSKKFLVLVNYFSQFIPDFAELTELLSKLSKKNTIFKWSNEHQNSFEKLNLALINIETMAYTPDTETKGIVDASTIGLGAISSQK